MRMAELSVNIKKAKRSRNTDRATEIGKLARLIKHAPQTLIIGNGGSFANAIHFANDLLACGISAQTLDPATLTATANDYGYEQVFSRWVRAVGKHGDLLVCLSGSGKSRNVLLAIREAKIRYMTVVSITGAYETKCTAATQAHFAIRRGNDMQAAEEAQLVIAHQVMRALKK